MRLLDKRHPPPFRRRAHALNRPSAWAVKHAAIGAEARKSSAGGKSDRFEKAGWNYSCHDDFVAPPATFLA
jgi:hypothetical protein